MGSDDRVRWVVVWWVGGWWWVWCGCGVSGGWWGVEGGVSGVVGVGVVWGCGWWWVGGGWVGVGWCVGGGWRCGGWVGGWCGVGGVWWWVVGVVGGWWVVWVEPDPAQGPVLLCCGEKSGRPSEPSLTPDPKNQLDKMAAMTIDPVEQPRMCKTRSSPVTAWLGLLLDCPRLALGAREFICERYQVVVRDQDFMQLSPSELAILITADALNVDREEIVFESLMDWIKHDENNRLKDLPELLHCVRFRLIPLDYLKDKVEKHQFIRFSQEIKKDLEMVKDAHKGRLPKPQKQNVEGEDGGTEEGDEEEGFLPGILNNNPRFGMFEQDLILMISDTGTVAYEPVGNECFVVSDSTEIPKNHCSLVTKQNQIFVVGGLLFNEEDKDEQFSSYFLQFDPVSSEWLGMPSQPNPRCLFGMTDVENSIYVVGGKELKDGEHVLDSVMIYDRQSFKWGESDPLPYQVYGHGTVSHNGLVYVIGGKSESKKCMRRVSMYNPTKFEWKDLAPLNTGRALFGVTIHDDQIYVVTGVTDSGLTSSVEVYDIATNKWSEFTEFPQERSSLNLVSMGGFLYAIGGFAMMPTETSEEPVPTEMTDIWRYDESEQSWTGILREIRYAEGASILSAQLNTLRLKKL
uniref:BACK domain-containing protein n=2 Tax=Knipowitschia caucasica TaxID=637954 RepID=A0AAV2JTM8_KNICA